MYKLILIFFIAISTFNCSGGDGGDAFGDDAIGSGSGSGSGSGNGSGSTIAATPALNCPSGGGVIGSGGGTIGPVPKVDLKLSDFSYKGAFTMAATYGAYKSRGSSGVFELSAGGTSFYFGGRKTDTTIGEFELPELVVSNDVADLNIAVAKQDYASMMGAENDKPQFEGVRIPSLNPEKNDRITGLFLFNGILVANVVKYYDATNPNTSTTMLIADPSNLATSNIYGFFSLDGAAHAAGWMSEVPPEWQQTLGGDILTGFASNFPIISRNSVGPSAFIVNSNDINPSSAPGSCIAVKALMDFSLANPLHPDTCNNNQSALCTDKTNGILPTEVGTNKLWTKKSWAVYGFIVPGTRTYAVFGSSGGHFSGIGYKIVEDNGNLCPGTCPAEYDDYYNYYWFFNVDDLVAVKNGKKLAYDVRPYDYGMFPAPFQTQTEITSRKDTPIRPIRGGDYDQKTNTLYLVLGGSIHARQIIVAYDVKIPK